MNYEDLTVVITTFHSEDKIYKCLDSIDKDLKIFVVDNANDLNFKNKIRCIQTFPNGVLILIK